MHFKGHNMEYAKALTAQNSDYLDTKTVKLMTKAIDMSKYVGSEFVVAKQLTHSKGLATAKKLTLQKLLLTQNKILEDMPNVLMAPKSLWFLDCHM